MYPAELMYNNINPKGFFSTFKQWKIQPIANGGYFWPGQNIKILIQSVFGGVMDPYRSHLQFTVTCDQKTLPVGLLQIDSSAQSFIEQFVLSSKNRQIQRIPQYSTLAAWLTDIGIAEMYAQGRQTEGLGFNNVDSLNMFSKMTSSTTSGSVNIYSGAANERPMHVRTSGLIFPTQTGGILPKIWNTQNNTSSLYSQPYFAQVKNPMGHLTPLNLSWNNSIKQHTGIVSLMKKFDSKDDRTSVRQGLINETGYIQNMRAEYLAIMQNNKYPDSTKSSPSMQIHLNSDLFNGLNIGGTSYQQVNKLVYQPGDYYKPYIPQFVNVNLAEQTTNDTTVTAKLMKSIPNQARMFGYSTLYSSNFCKGTHEPFISPTVPQCQMQNGVILRQKKCISKRTFKIPLISAIIGLLIPEDQFVLLPIKALNDILMQIVIDKFAMFTSGYLDISETDDLGSAIMQQRAFNITRVTYNMHTYSFWDPQVDQYINKTLADRIMINCNMWTLGNQYTINKGQNISNNWPVACTSQALNQIVVLCVSSDYVHHSFCRRHFRLSHNLQKFQLRINMEYFPPQPIIGNGGNPQLISNYDDNSDFIEQIYWSNNFMFNKVNPFPRINAYNFAINERCYDISAKGSMYPQTLKKFTTNGSNATENAGFKGFDNVLANRNYLQFNLDTSMGTSWIHENRYVGRAGYVFSFQPYAHSANFLVGMDCRNIRQFDVVLVGGTQNPFPRESQLYIFTRSSVIVEYGPNGIQVYGR